MNTHKNKIPPTQNHNHNTINHKKHNKITTATQPFTITQQNPDRTPATYLFLNILLTPHKPAKNMPFLTNKSYRPHLMHNPFFRIKKLKQYPAISIDTGGEVSEPGLNRWPDTNT